jgi:serine/threonine-protein kinase
VSGARKLDVAAELAPGDSVGQYTIEEPCGEGGMARVFKATAPDGDVVALKFVRPEFAVEEMFLKRFAREVDTAVRVVHPHVVPVLDSGEHEGVPYMAQPFITGGSLKEKIQAEGPQELSYTVDLCLQVAKGLRALHEHNLIHRDLKPANILLDERGSAFVADFGLAKDLDASLLTKPGQAMGTIDYMAPEQIRGEKVSPAADVYALGCVMYECVAGEPPFAEYSGMAVAWGHLQDEPPDPCAKRPDAPKDLSWAITRALEKDASERPSTPTAYARMVQAAAGLTAVPRAPEGG